MIGIHPVHRRLAELAIQSRRCGSFENLPESDQRDLLHCLQVNVDLVLKLDWLKTLSFLVHQSGDMDWQHDICRQIDELEAKLL